MYFTYVLVSKKDSNLYIGFCIDLKKRMNEHNQGLVVSTKHRRPMELIYYEACKNKKDAIKREKVLKTGFGRVYLKKRNSLED